MICHIVTEGDLDVAILRAILKPELDNKQTRIWSAGARSAADSLARSILAVRNEPVILVVDTDNQPVREVENHFEHSLGAAGPREMWRVCLAVPTIEAVFFDNPATFVELFDDSISESDKVLARFQPKEVLEKVLAQLNFKYNPEGVTAFLAKKGVSPLRQSRLVEAILKSVTELATTAVISV
jgi:hypothetical protein